MSALMNECEHGSDGIYASPPDDTACPYCEIAKLRARVAELENDLDNAWEELNCMGDEL